MTTPDNPFEFAGANDLPRDRIIDFYIEDFNYSRFIQSQRNVLLVGERGCGKSMTLIYNSWPVQRRKADRANESARYDMIGVYVPCNTPLMHKEEHRLLKGFHASVISEHNLVLSLTFAIAQTLAADDALLEGANEEELRSRLSYVLDDELPDGVPFFQAIMNFAQRENARTQRAINNRKSTEIAYDRTYSFASLLVPLLGCTRTIPRLSDAHFMLLIDDAQDLNQYQLKALSSWIAYRDHSLFSFKVAMAHLDKNKLQTSSGGSILEGHDYIRLDMVQPVHNETSNFGELARQLIQKRLDRFGIKATPEQFFPESPQFREDLAKAEEVVRKQAVERYSDDTKAISDHVYKYKRAEYFRKRSPKANRSAFSGFSTLAFLSTGVIRNLLMPCYWMYDKSVSLKSKTDARDDAITAIKTNVQADIILEHSRRYWDLLRDGIDVNIVGCSREDAKRCYQLLDQLAIHFRDRLLSHKSEPRANSFTISEKVDPAIEPLERLIEILRKAQILYKRSGTAKDQGKREWYYVPNRMLWPERGLDPHGQHARVSLKAGVLWAAAESNTTIPLDVSANDGQMGLFNA